MKTKKLIAGILFSLLSTSALALVVDRDSDGLIEINSLDDLNEIRNDPSGRTFRGSNQGCPDSGCQGFELTRDLDFDTNKNGYLDSGDWNGGRSWTPISMTAVTFNGNGHSISNFLNAIPVVTQKENIFVFAYGLFARGSRYIRDVHFVKPVIIVEGSIMPTNAIPYVGVVQGLNPSAGFSLMTQIKVTDAKILISRPSVLAPLENAGVIGGLAGEFQEGYVDGVSFSGSIENSDSAKHIIGGIAGTIKNVNMYTVTTQGHIVTEGIAGGAVGSGVNATIRGVSSSTKIEAGSAGGLVGSLFGSNNNIVNSVAKGELLSAEGGGLIGQLNTSGASVELHFSYSTSIVNNNGNSYVQLIGKKEPTDIVLNIETYQVVDASGMTLFAQDGAYTNPVTSAAIKCPTASVSPNCEKPNLLSLWGSWNFGSSNQFPEVKTYGLFRWFSTDTPGGSGDYEGIGRLTRYVPQYTCDNPLDIEVKEKKSGYVFNARMQSSSGEDFSFEFFNAKQGLKCLDTQQKDGRKCIDFKVSYLCGGSGVVPKWTEWLNQDIAKNDGVDYEPVPSKVCSKGQPIGIRATDEGMISDFYGSPQIPKKFSLSKGFECDNDANGPAGKENCKDYEVRMICKN